MIRVLILGNFYINLCCASEPLSTDFINLIDSFSLSESVKGPTHSICVCTFYIKCTTNTQTPLSSCRKSKHYSIIFLKMPVVFWLGLITFLQQLAKSEKQQVFVLTKCWRCLSSHRLISSTHWVHTKLCQIYLFSLYSGCPCPATSYYYNDMAICIRINGLSNAISTVICCWKNSPLNIFNISLPLTQDKQSRCHSL